MWLIGKLSSIVIYPIIALLSTFIPDISDYILSIESFLDSSFWPIAAFVKRVMVNFGVPQIVFTFILVWYTFRISMSARRSCICSY